MFTNDEISAFWNHSFITYSNDRLERFSLSPFTKTFLAEVGLPAEEALRKYGVKHYFWDAERFREQKINGKTYTIIGKQEDIEAYYAVNSRNDEFVMLNGKGAVYVNASLRHYLIFEQICREEFAKVKAYEEEEMMEAVSRMKKRFRMVEPHALEERHYWDQYLMLYEIGWL